MFNSIAMGQAHGSTNEQRLQSAAGMALPPELLQEIFMNIPAHHVVRVCRLVCHEWRALVDNEFLWKERCRREGYKPRDETGRDTLEDWKIFYFLTKARRNLLKNTTAEEGLKGWVILSNQGDGWAVEDVRIPHPNKETTKDFVTSYGLCMKSQLINLRKEGYNNYLMDKIRPTIRISDWFAPRFDCACEYEMQVQLLNSKKEILHSFSPDKISFQQWNEENWNEITHVFKNYGPGVRWVNFVHGGRDKQYWKGWYGIRVTDSRVEICPL